MLENVLVPLLADGAAAAADVERATQLLDRVGLGQRLNHRPAELSGGERQRAALARALIRNPTLLLADEPTGNLDSRTSIEIMGAFQQLNDRGITVVMVTHEPDIATYAKRNVVMRDGMVLNDLIVSDRRNAAAEIRKSNDAHA
mgnify:CR=1 FL=1